MNEKLSNALTNIALAASVAISAAEDAEREKDTEIVRLRGLLQSYLVRFDDDEISNEDAKKWLDKYWIPAVRMEVES